MEKLLVGKYRRKIDGQGRVMIPKELCEGEEYYARNREDEIVLYPGPDYEERAKEYLKKPETDTGRLEFANVSRLICDKDRRISLGNNSGFAGTLVDIIGNLDCIIIKRSP